jgi:hypothetical protein
MKQHHRLQTSKPLHALRKFVLIYPLRIGEANCRSLVVNSTPRSTVRRELPADWKDENVSRCASELGDNLMDG